MNLCAGQMFVIELGSYGIDIFWGVYHEFMGLLMGYGSLEFHIIKIPRLS